MGSVLRIRKAGLGQRLVCFKGRHGGPISHMETSEKVQAELSDKEQPWLFSEQAFLYILSRSAYFDLSQSQEGTVASIFSTIICTAKVIAVWKMLIMGQMP